MPISSMTLQSELRNCRTDTNNYATEPWLKDHFLFWCLDMSQQIYNMKKAFDVKYFIYMFMHLAHLRGIFNYDNYVTIHP